MIAEAGTEPATLIAKCDPAAAKAGQRALADALARGEAALGPGVETLPYLDDRQLQEFFIGLVELLFEFQGVGADNGAMRKL